LYGAEERASSAEEFECSGTSRQVGLAPAGPSDINDLTQGARRKAGLCCWVRTARETKQILARLDLIAEVLRSPDIPGQIHRAEAVATSISQGAPNGAIAQLALQVVAALGAMDRFPDVPAYMVTLDTALRRLREAVEAADRSKTIQG
jgi:hypothetical protein